MIDPSDRWAIHELIGLYGHVIDDRRWPDLELVFTADIVFDASDFGNPVTTSLEELRSLWRSDESMHPLAHHATNIIVTQEDDGTVRVLSKGIGVGHGGRVGSAVYRDVVVPTPDGWRLSHRIVELRRSSPAD
jgi:hypothetical protein